MQPEAGRPRLRPVPLRVLFRRLIAETCVAGILQTETRKTNRQDAKQIQRLDQSVVFRSPFIGVLVVQSIERKSDSEPSRGERPEVRYELFLIPWMDLTGLRFTARFAS